MVVIVLEGRVSHFIKSWIGCVVQCFLNRTCISWTRYFVQCFLKIIVYLGGESIRFNFKRNKQAGAGWVVPSSFDESYVKRICSCQCETLLPLLVHLGPCHSSTRNLFVYVSATPPKGIFFEPLMSRSSGPQGFKYSPKYNIDGGEGVGKQSSKPMQKFRTLWQLILEDDLKSHKGRKW